MNKTHEDYVSFEQAKALKELGFDWGCNHWYHPLEPYKVLESISYCNHNRFIRPYSAPFLAQVQKWLREVKGILVYASPSVRKNEPITWMIGVVHLLDKKGNTRDWWIGALKHDTYEQAFRAGIEKALELLKTENNGK